MNNPVHLTQDLDQLESILLENPAGLPSKEIQKAFQKITGRELGRRTLLRRLQLLQDKGRIRMIGERKGAVYVPIVPHVAQGLQDKTSSHAYPESQKRASSIADARDAQEAEPVIPLTTRSREIRQQVLKPNAQKMRVGYDGKLLDDYIPGKTWYLSQVDRDRLHELGTTVDENQPAGTFARGILDRLLIDLSWASSHLEGNTYSKLDTKNLIEFGQQAEGSDQLEAQMIINHKQAIELLVNQPEEAGFNRYTFLNLHAMLSHNLLANPADEGRIRTMAVDISGSVYVPLAIPQQVDARFNQILTTCDAIDDPFEQSLFLMVHIPYLQPFIDCNKRLSRIGANLSLIRANLHPLSFIDVPRESYLEATLALYEFRTVDYLKEVFLWAYERSCDQFRVIRDSLVQPNRLRLKYRDELAEVVRNMVYKRFPPHMASLRGLVGNRIGTDEAEAFLQMALEELVNLHEGNFARYGIRPSEFDAWEQEVRNR